LTNIQHKLTTANTKTAVTVTIRLSQDLLRLSSAILGQPSFQRKRKIYQPEVFQAQQTRKPKRGRNFRFDRWNCTTHFCKI